MDVQGYIIRITPYSEADGIVTLLTSDGNISFYGRSIFKIASKNAVAIQPYHFVEVSLIESKTGKNRYTLKRAELLSGLEPIIKDITAMSALFTLGEIFNKLIIEKEDARAVYPYFDKGVQAIKSGFDPLTSILIFFAATLRIIGYGIEISSCVNCGSKKDIIGVSALEGGLICKNCRALEYTIYDSLSINIIRYIFMVPAEKYTHTSFKKEVLLPILSGLRAYTYDIIGTRFKTIDDFLKIL
ncbi:MAG: DNA repair protein RecO [Erysipelotrichaceae bacterium]|nr:DNA repair protein RecO [Erysipelotrichaceae bacterium]